MGVTLRLQGMMSTFIASANEIITPTSGRLGVERVLSGSADIQTAGRPDPPAHIETGTDTGTVSALSTDRDMSANNIQG